MTFVDFVRKQPNGFTFFSGDERDPFWRSFLNIAVGEFCRLSQEMDISMEKSHNSARYAARIANASLLSFFQIIAALLR